MPYIEIRSNIEIDGEKCAEIHKTLGREIELIPGKTEKWLMTDVIGGRNMSFAGNDEPCIMAKVSIFGKSSTDAYDALTSSLCEKLGGALGVSTDRIYVKYEEVSTWGWNGMNF